MILLLLTSVRYESRKLTTVELKEVDSINHWIWADLTKRSLESDCLFTYLMIYIANLSSVVL